MWSQLLPTMIVVLSHIMSIPPIAAALQTLVLPLPELSSEIVEVNLPLSSRDEGSYDEASSGLSSWEESPETGESDGESRPHQLSRSNRLYKRNPTLILRNDGGGILRKTNTDEYKNHDDRSLSKSFEVNPATSSSSHIPNPMIHQNARSRFIDPGTLWALFQHQSSGGPYLGRQDVNGRIPNYKGEATFSDFLNRKQRQEVYEPFALDSTGLGNTFTRNEKRSPKCLRRCLAQGMLHPSQCHSLC